MRRTIFGACFAAVSLAAAPALLASATTTPATVTTAYQGARAHPKVAGPPRASVLTVVIGTVLSPPRPVVAADGRRHLAHELQLLNAAFFPVTLRRLDTLDAATGAVLQSLTGPALAAAIKRPEGGPFDGTLGAGLSALAILDATLPQSAHVPARLTHRLVVDFDTPEGLLGLAKDYRLGPTPVRRERPIVLGRPLRGNGWVAANGCCDAANSHRAGIVPVNGEFVAAERFAIDFVQLDAQRRLFSGPVGQLSGYPGYGEDVLSVAPGRVVAVHDGEPDQIPPALPPFSLETAGGNWIVLNLGGGRFAFYAHLQPGSLRVHPGDRVRTGQVIGLLGNSGNSTAPHLHFHLMNGPSTPAADSLPYEFARFTSSGTVTDENALFSGQPAPMDARLAGPHRHQLPLNLQVLDFGR